MIYQVDGQKKNVSIDDLEDHHMYIGMMTLDELKECYQNFHIYKSSIEQCEETSILNQNTIISHRKYYCGFIQLINARDIFIKKDSLAFFIF